MLMRFDPFRELDPGAQNPAADRPTVMPRDAYRRGDEFIVHFDVPGINPDSIDITVEKNVLTIRAERDWQPGEETRSRLRATEGQLQPAAAPR